MASRRDQYLQRLGLTRWKLRSALAPRAPAPAQVAAPAVTEVQAPDVADTPPVELPIPRNWTELEAAIAESPARTRSVLGVGNRQADWMVIGQTPTEEDESLVDQANTLLDNMLRAVGFERNDVFLANVLPGNNDARMAQFLFKQIEWVQPRLILCLGETAAQTLLQTTESMAQLRGTAHRHPVTGTPAIVSYRPEELLRQPSEKRKAWADLQLAMQLTKGEAR